MAAEFRPVLRVKGYREFVRATDRAGPEAKAAVRTALKNIGDPVRADAAQRLEPYSKVSAHGLQVRVTTTQVKVVQSLRKTTGEHPEYGSLQMRILLRARRANSVRTTREFEKALDIVVAHFNR